MAILKPSRFGKSIFLSTLANFLDFRNKDNFDNLFGGLKAEELAKGKLKGHVTSYHVLRFNFSLDVSLTMSVETIEETFRENINSQITSFCSNYQLDPHSLGIDDKKSFKVNMHRIADYIRTKDANLFVLVDEYDRFANKLLLDPFDEDSETPKGISTERWNKTVKGESGIPGSSPMRSFFETLKEIGNQSPKNYKSLTTGILPIAMADASGWNVCGDVSERPAFGDVFGFKRDDLKKALQDIGITEKKEVEKLLLFMRTHFNGHRFSYSSENLYNPQLCLWFLSNLLVNNKFKQKVLDLEDVTDTSSFPSILQEEYIDKNLKESATFLKLLSHYPMTTQIVQQLLTCRSIQQKPSLPISSAYTEKPPITLASSLVSEEGQEKTVWGVDISAVTKTGIKSDKLLNTITVQDEVKRILSLMYFYGLVTRTEPNKAILCIPNRVVFDPFFNYFMARNIAQVDAVRTFLSKSSAHNLKNVLRAIVQSLDTKMDNTYSEEALQSAIEASLKQMELFGVVQFKVFCNRPITNTSNSDYPFHFDLVLETNDSLFFIELKRLRPNAVKVFQKEESTPIGFSFTKTRELSTQVEWTDSKLVQQQEFLNSLEDVKILELETHYHNATHAIFMERDEEGEKINKVNMIEGEIAKENTIYSNWKDKKFQKEIFVKTKDDGILKKIVTNEKGQIRCETVEEVLQYATNQGIFYARLVKRDGGKISPKETPTTQQLQQRLNKRVCIFGVVNISRSTFIVQEHQKNRQLLKDFEPI